jgi:hypothetical protein
VAAVITLIPMVGGIEVATAANHRFGDRILHKVEQPCDTDRIPGRFASPPGDPRPKRPYSFRPATGAAIVVTAHFNAGVWVLTVRVRFGHFGRILA